ncbi:MAG: hypothetical protein IJ007_07835 [Oscillospiraceae bacterium]|nr:hypothetical protein [Oscillospiraceae bacterium]
MNKIKKYLFFLFHLFMKIFPAALCFTVSDNIYAESFSLGFFNVYLLLGLIFTAFAIASCYADYKLLKKDRDNNSDSGAKKLLLIDIILLSAAIIIAAVFYKQYSDLVGIDNLRDFMEFFFGI